MTVQRHRLQKWGSLAFALASLACIGCAVAWPTWIAETLHSRFGLTLLSVWCGGVAGFLHPEFRFGLAEGTREFIRHNNDDDDDPRAA
jgi:hypothetical protein